MKLFNVFLYFLGVYACFADYSSLSYVDRECGTDLSNLWLDVVAVVDNSHGMTSYGLQRVAANLASVFSGGTRIGANASEPRTTRLGLVTYNSIAKQNADLTFGTDRDNYRKVVIVYASSYNGLGEFNPLPVANRLKTSGVTIITVACDQRGDGVLLRKLAKIATPHMNFTDTDGAGNILGNIQGALLEANCFCPNDWIQYRQSFSDIYSFRYGVCIQPVGLTAVWRDAQFSCRQRWKNAFLVNEYDKSKHDFVIEAIKNSTGFLQPLSYHIGLNMIKGGWKWDQPQGWAQPTLQKWFDWTQGYPLTSSSMTSVLSQQNNQEMVTGWENIPSLTTGANYVCETASCDTDNYCTSNANCFCPNDWIQYRQSFSDIYSFRYGVCIQPVGLTAVWRDAQFSCRQRWQNAFLVNEYDKSKHDFVIEAIKNSTGFLQPLSYHIGLNMINGGWKWDQPQGWAQPTLQKWFDWTQGYPLTSSSMTSVLSQQNNQEMVTGWENIPSLTTGANYVCETASCDTDNYCASNGN